MTNSIKTLKMVHILIKNLKKEKQEKFVLSPFWKPEGQNRGVSRVMPPPEAPGKHPSLPLPAPGGSQRPLAPVSAPVFVAFFPLWLCPSPLLVRTPVIGLRACSKSRMISSQEPWLITCSLLYFQTKAYSDLWADINFFFFRGKGDTIRPTT